jgi:hypothetical protein
VKVGPKVNYPVGVRPQEWDEPNDNAALYRGVYAVTLNHLVDISFVPDVSAIAPPWDFAVLPDDIDTIETVDLARLATALFTSYVVTPNDRLAGTDDRIDRTPPEGMPNVDLTGTVFYVTTEEFSRFAAELDSLTDIAGDLHPRVRVDELRDRDVIAFIERRIVASPLLKPDHAELLGRGRGAT